MTLTRPSAATSLAILAVLLLAGCSSSFGSGGGSPPAKTYVVLPSGQAVPADQYRGAPVNP